MKELRGTRVLVAGAASGHQKETRRPVSTRAIKHHVADAQNRPTADAANAVSGQ